MVDAQVDFTGLAIYARIAPHKTGYDGIPKGQQINSRKHNIRVNLGWVVGPELMHWAALVGGRGRFLRGPEFVMNRKGQGPMTSVEQRKSLRWGVESGMLRG